MTVVVYYNGAMLDLKYFDEIGNLERGLTKAGHTMVKYDYYALRNGSIKEMQADAYILTPCEILAKEKFLQHLEHKYTQHHKKPFILYDFDEGFTTTTQDMVVWCDNNSVPVGKVANLWTSVTSVREIVNLLK